MRSIFILTALAAFAVPAHADNLGSRRQQYDAITRINKGVFQLGVDSTLILGYSAEGDSSLLRANLAGNLALRYFPRNNLGISLRGGGIVRKAGDATDHAFALTAWVDAYLRLGEGMFFVPGIGAGALFGSREVPAGPGQIAEASQVGGIAAAELLLTVFLNHRFSLAAGPQLTSSFGSTTPEAGDSTSFVAIDGGFQVGAAYSF
ncbi:MAG TPA: hypothetical protein VL172_04915 [Kofleriaceae bacterium]|nr:hypothetical protein [Kofleriaceae bacterium]